MLKLTLLLPLANILRGGFIRKLVYNLS